MYADGYFNWAVAAAVAYRCPRNVYLVLDDGTKVPCKCTWLDFCDDGRAGWTIYPADGKPVQVNRIAGLEVVAWEGTYLEIGNVTDGLAGAPHPDYREGEGGRGVDD